MGEHLIDGEFQSDKYPTTPRGKVPLSVKDPTAQDLLWTYAQRRRVVDAEFSDDLEGALRIAGYEVPTDQPSRHELSLRTSWRRESQTNKRCARLQNKVEELLHTLDDRGGLSASYARRERENAALTKENQRMAVRIGRLRALLKGGADDEDGTPRTDNPLAHLVERNERMVALLFETVSFLKSIAPSVDDDGLEKRISEFFEAYK